MNNQSRLSLDNGNSYISINKLSNYKNEIAEKWELIEMFMQSELREEIHIDIAPCSNIEFLESYLKKSQEDLIIG